ncbi:MAG: CPBP family intramembrane metalloprotease [Treponema sp.]|jgi:membrane protease YdiL (CAAX protease family)|nr:CPBP family intramembrane metalloprotease [Treponema sp.]
MQDQKKFTIKEAILLCFLLLGVRFVIELLLMLFHINAEIIYSMAFLGIVIGIVARSGKGELSRILLFKPVSMHIFLALVVMFLGFEIINSEITNIMAILIPIPDRIFGEDPSNIFMIIICTAIFPAFTEEIFFRGILLKRLSAVYSKRKALIASALLFGMMHLNPWQFVHASISGLFYGWLYLQYGTIWLGMFMHFYNNILASFMVYPVKILPNERSYSMLVLHPLWFDIMGIMIFFIGLGLTIGIAKTQRPKVN